MDGERFLAGAHHAQVFTGDAFDVGIRVQPGDQRSQLVGVTTELLNLGARFDDSIIKAIRLQQTLDAAVNDEIRPPTRKR